MGPEKFLSIIPLNLEAEDLSQANVWVFPILKQNTIGGSLRFYAEQILDMAENLKQRSSQSEGRVVSARNADALVYSLWSLLPSFCNYPLDTAISFGDDLKTPMCSTLAEEPDMRGIICSALHILIQQNKNILTNNIIHDGEYIVLWAAYALAQHLDIAMSLIPGLPEKAIDVLFFAIDPVLKDDQVLVQKNGYKVLSIMLKNCDSFISNKLEELLKLMIKVMPSCHSSSKRHRLDCLYYLIIHISKNASEEGKRDMISSFLTEIILSLKEVLPDAPQGMISSSLYIVCVGNS